MSIDASQYVVGPDHSGPKIPIHRDPIIRPIRDRQYGIIFSTKTCKTEQKPLKSEHKSQKLLKTVKSQKTMQLLIPKTFTSYFPSKGEKKQTQSNPILCWARPRTPASRPRTDTHAIDTHAYASTNSAKQSQCRRHAPGGSQWRT